jgi:deoxyribose-phosphate aldolase
VTDVKKLRTHVGEAFGLKVGGLKQEVDALTFVEAGANRIGLLA